MSKRACLENRLLPIVATVLLACAGSPVAASTYTSMVVFGDSLSDDGNNAMAIGTSPTQPISGNSYVPTFPYFSGVYSNGPVWATDAAQQLGLTLAPSLAGGTDYAYGGATTANSPGFPPSLATQAAQYLATNPAGTSSALYVVAGGGNDARATLTTIAQAQSQTAANAVIAAAADAFALNTLQIVKELNAAGAQHIVVWDTPNLGLAPAVVAAGGATVGTALSETMNQALAAALAGLSDVSTFDIFALGTSIAQDPSAYGFTDVTDACGAVPGANCNQYAYWDGIHPTAAAHEVIADAFVNEVTAVPEPSTWAMMMMGFVGIAAMTFRRQKLKGALAAT